LKRQPKHYSMLESPTTKSRLPGSAMYVVDHRFRISVINICRRLTVIAAAANEHYTISA
jgi:hypothetical protein